MAPPRNWKPGSFTKNFGWGAKPGLLHLVEAIDVAFAGDATDVERSVARQRLSAAGIGDFIPINFFLLNRTNGQDVIVADELVRSALAVSTTTHDFDMLAVFALNLSIAGTWKNARPEQRYPAEWAKHFVVSKVFAEGKWNGHLMNAEEIRNFIEANPDYQGTWAQKAATNLSYIYEVSGVRSLRSGLSGNLVGFCCIPRAREDLRRSSVG